MTTMTAEALRAICKEHELYFTPELNDRLYCNFRGFTQLGGLEKYSGLKALFLEGNALASLSGLPPLPELKCLYLQQNGISSLGGLSNVASQLHTLNLSGNALTSLQGLEPCTQLQTLLAPDNQLSNHDGIVALAELHALETLDLQGNRLDDAGAMLHLLARLPHLKCLYLKGNPLVHSCQNYRKRVISALPGLTFLDDRPIYDEERRCAEAWAHGGTAAERAERERCFEERHERARLEFEEMQAMRAAAFSERRELLGLPADPFMDDARLEQSRAEVANSADAQQRMLELRLTDSVPGSADMDEERSLPPAAMRSAISVVDAVKGGAADSDCESNGSLEEPAGDN